MNPTTVDLCFTTPDRATFLADVALRLAHLLKPSTGPDGAPRYVESGPDHAIDFVGDLVATPAVFAPDTFPSVVTTPATYHPGARANLRLMGAVATPLAFALRAVSFPGGTRLLDSSEIPADQLRWSGGATPFAFALPIPVEPPAPPQPTVASLRTQLKALLAARRYDVENGGVNVQVSSGIHPFDTGRDTRATWLALSGFAAADPEFSQLWKTLAGAFITLTAADVAQIVPAIYAHVATAFGREAALSAQLDAADTLNGLEALRPQIELFA